MLGLQPDSQLLEVGLLRLSRRLRLVSHLADLLRHLALLIGVCVPQLIQLPLQVFHLQREPLILFLQICRAPPILFNLPVECSLPFALLHALRTKLIFQPDDHGRLGRIRYRLRDISLPTTHPQALDHLLVHVLLLLHSHLQVLH